MFQLASFMSRMTGVASTSVAFIVNLIAATCSRATTRTRWDGGLIDVVPINTAAIVDGDLSVADSATNLLLNSVLDGAVIGSPGTPPTSWGPIVVAGSLDAIVNYGAAFALQISTVANRHYYFQNVAVAANTTYIYSMECITADGQTVQNLMTMVNTPVGATTAYSLNCVPALGSAVASDGDIVGIILTVAATAGTAQCRFGLGASGAATGTVVLLAHQVEIGEYRSPLIPTTVATVTRAADICTVPTPSIIGATWAIDCLFTPDATGQTTTILSSYTDANNYTEVLATATTVILRKRVAGVSYDATFTYTHVAGTTAHFQIYGGAAGTGIRCADASADINVEVFQTNADATAAVFTTTLSIGNLNGLSVFVAAYKTLTAFLSKEAAGW